MGINILIADDDNVFRELVEDILRKNGYHVFSACDGEEAIEKFYKYHSQLDLVILDVMMPGPDGWETLAEIRNISEIPVMMLTALGDETNEINGLLSMELMNIFQNLLTMGYFWQGYKALQERQKREKHQPA